MNAISRLRDHGGVWQTLPQGRVYWQPHFLERSVAEQCFEQLNQELDWQQQKIRMFGREVLQPRLQAWCGDAVYTYSGLTMQPDPWSPTLQVIRQQLVSLLDVNFNSVLANQYRNGHDYMGWHQDNEPELGEQPVIASVSLGAPRRFVLRHRQTKEKREYLLTSGSLLVMAGELQHYWQHTVPKTRRPTAARINLTFREIMG
ncbi:alpha-ketoglutarate-dependent dioxygenase AlkB [Photobacterium gaetbulicola]|uniref:alpha-ketoglutarate-dependent dioxygenase AlkB family protein n=1 Tax=Photobacterium gaetbulicola TaxID=1295392 RepID=UPI0005CBA096|nr:alpha-ketoglutarate-dependent dioxygenase AlkB [Photobacterium gaetbulicola]PSU11819.1 alpha-ketoglutarate-dependent dioxygenase AlkB [Photobacterium gaetbulicola]